MKWFCFGAFCAVKEIETAKLRWQFYWNKCSELETHSNQWLLWKCYETAKLPDIMSFKSITSLFNKPFPWKFYSLCYNTSNISYSGIPCTAIIRDMISSLTINSLDISCCSVEKKSILLIILYIKEQKSVMQTRLLNVCITAAGTLRLNCTLASLSVSFLQCVPLYTWRL